MSVIDPERVILSFFFPSEAELESQTIVATHPESWFPQNECPVIHSEFKKQFTAFAVHPFFFRQDLLIEFG